MVAWSQLIEYAYRCIDVSIINACAVQKAHRTQRIIGMQVTAANAHTSPRHWGQLCKS